MIKKLQASVKNAYKKGLLHILLGSFMTKFVAMFGSIFIVRILSKQEYGELGYMENFYGYIYLLAGFGLNNAIFRYVVLGKESNKQECYYRYIRKTNIAINCVLSVCALFVVSFYLHPSEFNRIVWLIKIYMFVLPLQSVCESEQLTFRALYDNGRYALYSFLTSLLLVCFRVLFAYVGGLPGVVVAQILVYITMEVAQHTSIRRKYFQDSIHEASFISKSEKKEIFTYSIQYMITNGIWTAFMLNDVFLLGRLANDPSIVADYKVAYTIPGSISIISTALGVFVAPYFVQNEKDKDWVKRNFVKTMILNILSIFIIACMIIVLSRYIILIIYGEKYIGIVRLMQILLVASFVNAGVRYPCANILAAMGKVKYNMCVSVVGIIVQISLNLYLIPKYGSIGAAITSILVYGVMATVLIIIFIRKYFIGGNKHAV